MAGTSLEFHCPILSISCAGFTHFCLEFIFKPVVPHNFLNILHALSCYRDYQIKLVDGEIVLDLLNDSLAEEIMLRINEIIGFPAVKHQICST